MTPEKKEADRLFTEFYIILFDSESDKGEEILISKLARDCAVKCCDEKMKFAFSKAVVIFYEKVKNELKKL